VKAVIYVCYFSETQTENSIVPFYSGYLVHEKNRAYLPQVLVSTFRGMLDSYEDRQVALFFKLTVELSMMLHVTAAANEIGEDYLSRLRGKCVQEVKELRGTISLDDAVRFHNED